MSSEPDPPISWFARWLPVIRQGALPSTYALKSPSHRPAAPPEPRALAVTIQGENGVECATTVTWSTPPAPPPGPPTNVTSASSSGVSAIDRRPNATYPPSVEADVSIFNVSLPPRSSSSNSISETSLSFSMVFPGVTHPSRCVSTKYEPLPELRTRTRSVFHTVAAPHGVVGFSAGEPVAASPYQIAPACTPRIVYPVGKWTVTVAAAALNVQLGKP